VKDKQDSRNYFESLISYSKTMQYVINFIVNELQISKAYSSLSFL